MKIVSLILCTFGRSSEISRFLESLEGQSNYIKELIIADQNKNTVVDDVVGGYSLNFPVIILKTEKGLSLSRNEALTIASGDIVAFPDDDCWYPPGVLERVLNVYSANKLSKLNCVLGQWLDPSRTVGIPTPYCEGRSLSPEEVARHGNSISIFMDRDFIEGHNLRFNEALGLGAKTIWGSGEESDFLLRSLKLGAVIIGNNNVVLYHPFENSIIDNNRLAKGLSYSLGNGYMLAANGFSCFFMIKRSAITAGGLLLSIVKFQKGFVFLHAVVFLGRIAGFLTGRYGNR